MSKKIFLKNFSYRSIKAAFFASLLCINVPFFTSLKAIHLSLQIHKDMQNETFFENLQNDLKKICNQKGIFSYSKHSNAQLERRKGSLVAITVTMRDKNMFKFFNNIVIFALKNLRDFEGFYLNSFDNNGNYTFSNLNRLAFSEIDFNENYRSEKFNITFQMNLNKRNNSLILLKMLGLPFKLIK